MSFDVYFVTADLKKARSTLIDERRILETLGPSDEAVAIHLKELFQAITEAVRPTLQTPGELMIELSGSIDVKVDGSVKFLVFNASAEGSASGTMKVTLQTKIEPQNHSTS